MMRWSCPISSSREYFEMAQNWSLTYWMTPRWSVMATIDDSSRANLMSRSSFSAPVSAADAPSARVGARPAPVESRVRFCGRAFARRARDRVPDEALESPQTLLENRSLLLDRCREGLEVVQPSGDGRDDADQAVRLDRQRDARVTARDRCRVGVVR
jgi:hypothetical protein